MQQSLDVGILGATGAVGQQFVNLLARHPWFRPAWLAASERSEGKSYRDAAPWRLSVPMPESLADKTVEQAVPGVGPRLVFSALDASVAGDLELAFAEAGHIVVSNARNYRMEDDVPLLVPEVNADHLQLLRTQASTRGWRGAIVTNPNCSTVFLAMSLAALRPFGLRSCAVTTLQAVSGAGYPGVPSLGRSFARYSGEHHSLHFRRRTENRDRNPEDPRPPHAGRCRAPCGRTERSDDACSGPRRPHGEHLGCP
jgi:aspartate-semialdehyde dehydrogenase